MSLFKFYFCKYVYTLKLLMVVDSGWFENEHFRVFRKIITKALSWITSDLKKKDLAYEN